LLPRQNFGVWAKIATSPLFGFQGAQNDLGRRQV
jgi:hypothetical protein